MVDRHPSVDIHTSSSDHLLEVFEFGLGVETSYPRDVGIPREDRDSGRGCQCDFLQETNEARPFLCGWVVSNDICEGSNVMKDKQKK